MLYGPVAGLGPDDDDHWGFEMLADFLRVYEVESAEGCAGE